MGNDPGIIHVQEEKGIGQQAVNTPTKMHIVKAEIRIGRNVENGRRVSQQIWIQNTVFSAPQTSI